MMSHLKGSFQPLNFEVRLLMMTFSDFAYHAVGTIDK